MLSNLYDHKVIAVDTTVSVFVLLLPSEILGNGLCLLAQVSLSYLSLSIRLNDWIIMLGPKMITLTNLDQCLSQP